MQLAGKQDNDPMCYQDLEDLDRGDFRDVVVDDDHVTYFSDGTSTRHGGGPAGDMHYDKYGEEC